MAEREIFQMLRALAPETRQRILVQLGKGPQPAAAIARALNVPISTVRGNLRKLEGLRLVRAAPEGRTKVYRLGDAAQVLAFAGRSVLSIRSRSGGEFFISRPEGWLRRG